MALISGTFRNDVRLVAYEAKQDGERWTCLAKIGGERFEASTWAPSPWPCLENLVGQALDSASRETEPGKFDMNKRLVKPPATPIPLRRRGKVSPGDLPDWKPPETA
jgi:hypothetical protein